MRKAVALLLFLALLMPALAFFGSLLTLRIQIKQEVKRSLAQFEGYEEELVLVKIPKTLEISPGNDFIRFDEGEFFYLGTMYDVLRSEEKDTETWYWCYRDREETLMVAKALDIVNQLFGTERGQDAQRMSLQVFFPQFIAQSSLYCPLLEKSELDASHSFEYGIPISDGYLNPPFIPPALS